jgi:hypothetical protein
MRGCMIVEKSNKEIGQPHDMREIEKRRFPILIHRLASDSHLTVYYALRATRLKRFDL